MWWRATTAGELTLAVVGRALASSPRQLQRAYAQFGETSFREDLLARRMAAAAELLLEQRSIPVADVARLVGYRQALALRARVPPPLRADPGALPGTGAAVGGWDGRAGLELARVRRPGGGVPGRHGFHPAAG